MLLLKNFKAHTHKKEVMKLTKDEIHKLFDFLNKLYSAKPYPRDVSTIAIWEAVLKPWDYKEVRGAVLERTKTTHFRPDPAEIVAFLPKCEVKEETQRDKPSPDMVAAVRDLHISRPEFHDNCAKLGIPSMEASLARGMSLDAWWKMQGEMRARKQKEAIMAKEA